MKNFIRTMRAALLLAFMLSTSFAQTTDWQIANGKAYAEMQIVLSGKSQDEIYRNLSRWLVQYYMNPEEILKAKIHGEYLRGVAYEPHIITSGPLTKADLHYTFVAKISENTLTFTITNAVLVSPGGQDADVDQGGTHRVEDFFQEDVNKKSKAESEKILVALNDFSGSLLSSLDQSIRADQN